MDADEERYYDDQDPLSGMDMEEDAEILATLLKHIPSCLNAHDIEELLKDIPSCKTSRTDLRKLRQVQHRCMISCVISFMISCLISYMISYNLLYDIIYDITSDISYDFTGRRG